MPTKIANVVGARPNFMKIAPLMRAYDRHPEIEPMLIHTGQHYDERMSDLFFRQLAIPEPDVNLGVGSGTQAEQTAHVMTGFEALVHDHEPDVVLVVGDVNSTIACGLVAAKSGCTLVHIEAGLRSFDRSMPEEINRVLTDSISDWLFCTEPSGVENLANEGVDRGRCFLVGNLMIDTLLRNAEAASRSDVLERHGLEAGGYAVLTLHRPSNVDDAGVLSGLLDAVERIQKRMPVIFPIHPRTRKCLERHGLAERADRMEHLRQIEPAGYLDFLKLMQCAGVVLTDSGGIQEETTILRVPCLTLRWNTERPITIERGTNRLVGTDPQRIVEGFEAALDGALNEQDAPPLWDGRAAERVVDTLASTLGLGSAPANTDLSAAI